MKENLGAARIKDLVDTAVFASARSDKPGCMAVLNVLMFEGTKLDCLAFTIGCLGKLTATVNQDYALAITKGEEQSDAQLLAALMLIDYMAGDTMTCYRRWLMADDDTAAGTVGFILRVTGERMRTVWARLS